MIALVKPFPGSLARRHRWLDGDRITHLDGRPVEDILDLYYYVPAGAAMTLTIARAGGETVEVALPPDSLDAITSCFAPLEFKTCACQCVFCFIDQNPAGMRDAVYVKDEDYRFSFLYGNYITLTSLGRKGLERIISQRMSPLFVSVHATDIDVRTRMLGIKRRIDVVQIMQALVANGIELHTQVVLCPGWNDGEVLKRTYTDLRAMASGRAGVRSLAIVPVGLTAHRDGLTRLQPVTAEIAREVIAQVTPWQHDSQRALGRTFVYLSDEFYLLSETPFPDAASYDDFPQVDNGIGLTSSLKTTWREQLAQRRKAGTHPRQPVTVLTGTLAAAAWTRELAPALFQAGAPPITVLGVPNDFYGPSVTVAGLLCGRDLKRALDALPPQPRRTVLLSPRVFNSDGLTLDDMTLAEIASGSPHEVLTPPEEGFIDFWARLA
jgi:putative radical SAM enzyme (TIGR03279 family)